MEDNWYELRQIRKTDKPFLQLRRFSATGVVHIQGYGEEANRPYGFADRYSMPDVVVEAVAKHEQEREFSLASDEKLYFRNVLEIVRYADGHQLIIKIEHDDNNDDGQFVLDMDSRADGLLNFAEENGLVTDRSDEQRFISIVGEEE